MFRCLHLECEQQVEGFVEPQPGVEYVCCSCRRTSPDLDPPHRDLEARLTLDPEEPVDAQSESEPQQSPSPMDCQRDRASEEAEELAGRPAAAGHEQTGEQVSGECRHTMDAVTLRVFVFIGKGHYLSVNTHVGRRSADLLKCRFGAVA